MDGPISRGGWSEFSFTLGGQHIKGGGRSPSPGVSDIPLPLFPALCAIPLDQNGPCPPSGESGQVRAVMPNPFRVAAGWYRKETSECGRN
jgi:hypothetical protein